MDQTNNVLHPRYILTETASIPKLEPLMFCETERELLTASNTTPPFLFRSLRTKKYRGTAISASDILLQKRVSFSDITWNLYEPSKSLSSPIYLVTLRQFK